MNNHEYRKGSRQSNLVGFFYLRSWKSRESKEFAECFDNEWNGFKAIIIFGNPQYYQKFGFINAEKYGIKTSSGENLDAFMAIELFTGALNGITGKYYEDKVFEIEDEELEIFEREFPYKENILQILSLSRY